MIEDSSKDYTEMLEDLSKPYGCYGIKTAQGFSAWIDQWIINGGEEDCLQGLMMIINRSTGHMTMWNIEEILHER